MNYLSKFGESVGASGYLLPKIGPKPTGSNGIPVDR